MAYRCSKRDINNVELLQFVYMKASPSRTGLTRLKKKVSSYNNSVGN